MKGIYVPILAVLAILASSLFPFVDAVAENTTCILIAGSEKVRVVVWDRGSSGNRLGEILGGWLEKGDRQKIKSNTGSISFSYQLAHDDKSFGDNRQTCKNGNTFQVP